MRQKRRKNLLYWHVSVYHWFLLVFCEHKILCTVSCLLCCGTKHTKNDIILWCSSFSFLSKVFSSRDKSTWLKTVYYNTIGIRNVNVRYICVDYRQHQLLSRPQNMQGMYNLKKTFTLQNCSLELILHNIPFEVKV